jgi:phosphoglycolate phosphatase
VSSARPSDRIPAPRAILFDWDNTLVDGWEVIRQSLNAAFEFGGLPPWTLDEAKTRVRASLRDSFPRLFGDRWQEAMGVFYSHFEANHLAGLREMPEAGELLAEIAGRGIYLAVVSNKTGRFLRLEAGHLGWTRHFSRLVGAGDAACDKPAVDPVDLALAGSFIERGPHVWFVGDADIDIDCAAAAGCLPVLLRLASPKPEEFPHHWPALHHIDCGALRRFLREL